MTPLLFPLVLILYAEGSYCYVTRSIARIVLYSYLITLITTMYAPTLGMAHFTLVVVHTFCYMACISLSQKVAGKVVFFILMLIVWWVDLSLSLGTLAYDIQIGGYSILGYSNYLYREGTILAISLCSYIATKDVRVSTRENLISLTVLMFFFIESRV